MALKYLILHESPKEASTVNKFLPKEYKAMSTWGHFMETSSKKLDIDKDKWKLNWKISWNKSKKDNIKKIWEYIKVVLKNKWQIIIATDPDREWAVIAAEIVKYYKLKKSDYIVHWKVTDLNEKPYMNWIKNSFDDIDWNLVEAGLTRQILDKLVWFELTEFLWKLWKNYKPFLEWAENNIKNKVDSFKLKNKNIISNNKNIKDIVDKFDKLSFKDLHDFKARLWTSFWRVQSSVLCLLVDKELEKFEKQLERKINIFAKDSQKKQWEFSKNIQYETNTDLMLKIYTSLENLLKQSKTIKVKVLDVKKERKFIKPPIPMDTQMAQSSINNMFGYSLKNIMDALQKLYEAWHTTYMRTDSNSVPDSYKDHIIWILKSNWNLEFVNRKIKQDENSQGWHEWILPTKVFDLKFLPKSWNEKEDKILEYIIRRSTAAFMKDAEIEYFTYSIEIIDEKWKKFPFILKDTSIVSKWFLEVFNYQLKKYEQKVFYKIWDEISIKEIVINEKNIKLSGWYTEWWLVKELKNLWIGRPSTWQSIISILKDKGYINIIKNKIELTPKGYFVRQIIIFEDKFKNFPKSDYTAKMENLLDEVSKGKMTKNILLDKVNSDIIDIKGKEVAAVYEKKKKNINKNWEEEPETHLWKCPSCKKGFIEKKKVNSKNVWGCTNWMNKCKFTIWGTVAWHIITDEEAEELIKNKKSKLITDFKSRAGKEFSAYYVFSKEKWFWFEFEN